MPSATTTVTEILLIRHGDRYDYAIGKDAWMQRCKASASLVASDPPLSALGHQQAHKLARQLSTTGDLDAIYVSPYLRALQTAQPLAQATNLPLLVDFVAAEAHQRPALLPALDMRLPYFPEIDESFVPLMNNVVTDEPGGSEPGVEPRLEHMRRMRLLAQHLRAPVHRGKRVAIVTHAASIALVAALIGAPSLEAAGKLAPCGVCQITIAADGSASVMSNDMAMAAGGGATAAWGFVDSAEPLASSERTWQESARLGPTDVAELKLLPAETSGAKRAAADKDDYAPESVVEPRCDDSSPVRIRMSGTGDKALAALPDCLQVGDGVRRRRESKELQGCPEQLVIR